MVAAEVRKRETLYAAFITESSKLAMDAFDHTLDNPLKLLEVYALQNRIRLTASMPVVDAAETTTYRILQQYFGPNVALEELKKLASTQPSERDDPLRLFSEACRVELAALQRTV